MADLTGAFAEGRENGLETDTNRNPYDREDERWVQYERGFSTGKSRRIAQQAMRDAQQPRGRYAHGGLPKDKPGTIRILVPGRFR